METPNPTDGAISVTGVNEPTIKVYNILGEMVKLEERTNTVSISELPPGIYLVKIFSDNQELLKVVRIYKH